MKTSQEMYDELLKGYVVPRLRELGFKGSGSIYSLANETHYVLLGFQKASANNQFASKFTINIMVADKQEWANQRVTRSYLPEKPSPNVVYGSFAWQSRIGQLLPGGQDIWWSITGDSNTEKISAEVLNAIEGYALRAINEHLA